jgi:hypothetical protein
MAYELHSVSVAVDKHTLGTIPHDGPHATATRVDPVAKRRVNLPGQHPEGIVAKLKDQVYVGKDIIQ